MNEFQEAVALAQAEAAMNTCTVSVATTHRTVPMSCGTDNSNDLSNNITTNTTNLINININNAGTITAVAGGENHQLNHALNSIPRSTQTQPPSITSNGEVNNKTPRNTTISVCTSQNQNSNRSPICTNSRCQITKEETEIEPKPNSILPPPLFDGKSNKELMKTPSSSRRHHRTIPRHFTAVDPILNGNSNSSSHSNKKPTCQCPIQHVPMSYMSNFNNSQHNSNGLFMSNLATTKNGKSSNSVGKSTSFPISSKNHQATKINSENVCLLENSSLNNTVRRSNNKSLNSTSNKIPTISKVVSSDINSKIQTVLIPQEIQPNPIHSILKNKTNSLKLTKNSTELFPIQLIDSVLPNPVLPPKMYKNNLNLRNSQNPVYVSKIHTISKPNDNPNYNISPSFRNKNPPIKLSQKFSKTLPRNDETNKTTNTYVFLPSGFCEKSQSLGKINAGGFSANHITYSLPKVTSNNRLSLRTSISDVVNKVPSIVNIPSPISTQITTTTVSTIAAKTSPSTSLNPSTSQQLTVLSKLDEKPLPLPVCTTSKNCSNPKEHFLPNDTSIDDEYLSECENCKSAHGSRYYLDEEIIESPQETMTLQRKPQDNEDEQGYYRTSQTLPTNNKQKST